MYCSKCGQPNIDSANFCVSCGSALNLARSSATPILPAFHQVATDSDVVYRAFIGPNNQYYYLTQFHQFDRAGQTSTTWHWPAFFVSWYWLLYRKMWQAAVIYFCLPYAIMMIGGMLGVVSAGLGAFVSGILWIAYLIGIFVWFPMNANALYYQHAQQKIQEIRLTTSAPDQLNVLAWKGGTSGVVIIFVVVSAFIFMIGILAGIAIPAYQDYMTRAKVVQAMVIGNQAEAAFTQYYQQQDRFPSNLEEAGFNVQLPPYIEKIALNDSTEHGIISITLAEQQLPLAVQGKKIFLTPQLSPDKSITWTCSSAQIDEKFLPESCR